MTNRINHKKHTVTRPPKKFLTIELGTLITLLVLVLVIFSKQTAHTAGDLSVEIIAAPNLIVDSNVLSPSTQQPVVATVIGKFCNTSSSNTLQNVTGYIGNFTNGTPGIYPVNSNPTIGSTTYDGDYSFTHLGGTADATRFIGDLAPGECNYQYWSFSYPKTATSGGSTIPAWGNSVKPDDDLFLTFDIWASGYNTGTASTDITNQSHTMTMRNEISAMANKIKPNGNPGGLWFNTDTSSVDPGDTITTNGILYRLGNVNQGFDNDNDGIPDYNAWLQPFGDPSYDPSCFRLISTTGVLTVTRSAGNPDLIIPFKDQLYFTDLPPDNTNVSGEVFYTFLALGGPCNIPISPYQEVASGSDNEKFNGDYGTGIPPVISLTPSVTVNKNGDVSVNEGATVTYNIPFQNTGSVEAGLTLSSGGVYAPMTISDTVPEGMQYVCGSASASLGYTPSNAPGYVIYYSEDSGASWSTSEPASCPGTNPTSTGPNNKIMIRWQLTDPLPKQADNGSGTATFQAVVPATYISGGGTPFIENCAAGSFGDGNPFAEGCTTTIVNGTNSIGDYVWADTDYDGVQDGGESGINNITVWLYWDENGNGVLDADEMLVDTTTTTTNGFDGYYEFTNLPNGDYIVKVDGTDTDLPTGYNYTTPKEVAVTGLSGGVNGVLTVDTADFGFGPILDLTKSLTNGEFDNSGNDNLYEGQLATYLINVTNTRPGGTGPGNACQYTLWTGTAVSPGNANTQWQNIANAIGVNDSAYAYTVMANANDHMDLGGYFTSPQGGNITKVEYVMYLKELVDLDANDSMDVVISNAATIYDSTTNNDFDGAFFATKTEGEPFIATIDLGTSLGWADFDSAAANPINVNVDGNRGGGTSGELALDAAAFVITTDQTCGDPSDTLNPVPVTDTYNPAELEFVSANPPVSSQGSGTLTWNNVGPLAAGETQQIEVTFKVLATSGVVNNAASSTTAKYLDGRSANSASDNVNADIFPAHTIGDYVWFDADGAGDQDAGEPGLAGVVVELYLTGNTTIFYNGQTYGQNDLIATTVTDANGAYLFEGIPGSGNNTDDYEVRINEASSPVLTGLAITTGNDPFTINNLNGDITNADFGYNGNSIVYGSVWHDANANASDPTIDTTETYIAGVTVQLCTDQAGTSCVATTTTDENGRYQFTNVTDGTYYVVVTAPGTQVAAPTGENTKTTCGTCNNATPAITVNSATDQVYGGYDFGYSGANIGDTLFVDWNGNGTQDSGEEGIPNINVYLYRNTDNDGQVDADDTLLETAVTGTNGDYLFTNYPAGSYLVVVDSGDPDFPGGYVPTGDPDATLDGRHAFTTDGTNNKLDVDFGYQPQGTSSIGDTIWNDLDGDGTQSSRESGIQSVAVTLYQDQNGDGVVDPEDAAVATTTTDANGNYLFGNLAAGNYIVKVDDANFNSGQPLYSLSHSNGTKNNLHQVTLSANQAYDLADFGYATSAIGDLVWQDNDGDGVRDPNEPGINGVTVNLYEDTNNNGVLDASEEAAPVRTAVTANDDQGNPGHYYFGSLPAGNYVVKVDTTSPALANYTLTGDPDSYNTIDPTDLSCTSAGAQACDSTKFLDNQPSTSQYDLNPGLALGRADLSADFGYQPQGVIGDTLWIDADNDGVRDIGEVGITDVTVKLCSDSSCATVVDTTTTDENGEYSFAGLTNGQTYYVQVDTADPDFPTGLTQTHDPDGTLDNTGSYIVNTAVNNGVYLDMDFGYQFTGSNTINGTIWHDTDSGGQTNGAGDIDGGETIRYQDVTVYLWHCGTGTCSDGDEMLVGSTLTNSSGQYSFTNLANGTYRVIANPNAYSLRGTTPTTTTDYDGTPTSDPTATVSGGTTATRDFGFISQVDLGDLPANYNLTTLANNGARHLTSANLYLGTSQPDTDPDGAESTAANGDGADDSDGIVRRAGAANPAHGGWTNGTVASGNGGSVDIIIGGSWNGVPQLFIDFDGDDPTYALTEVTLRDASGNPITMPLSPGTHRVYFDVPAGTFDGVTASNPIYLRARLSTTGGLSAVGLANNGEVEDYQFNFGPTAVSLQSFRTVDQNPFTYIAILIVMMLITSGGILYRRYKHQ